mgnify:CR=1 FL=1
MLYIVATPIGNLEDMTFRAIRTLKEVDYIFAEDTRVTKKLLDHYEIKNTVYRYDEHTKQHQVANIINLLNMSLLLIKTGDIIPFLSKEKRSLKLWFTISLH